METPFDGTEQLERDRSACLDIIDKDKEHLYFCPVCIPGDPMLTEAFGSWRAVPVEYCNNYFELGGWGARRPDNITKLAGYGITNPIRSLVEREDVLSVVDQRYDFSVILQYVREHYDAAAAFSRLEKAGDNWIVKYQKYLQKESFSMDPTGYISDLRSDFDKDGYLCLTGKVRDTAAPLRDLYCNLSTMEGEKTYRLNLADDGSFSAGLWDNDFTGFEEDSMYFFYPGDGGYYGLEKNEK